jgi:thiosulfate/3-mercaptopyruvate sulfurtransferase
MTHVGILTAGELAGMQIVDARTRQEYEAAHIPGAMWMGWEEWCDPAPAPSSSILRKPGYWGALRNAPPGWYASVLADVGLRHDQPIAVYADGLRSRGREGRIAWMLLYLGASDVRLIDGGWQAWQMAGGGIEFGVVSRPQGRFPVRFQESRRRPIDSIAQGWHDAQRALFVDTRSAAEYAGALHDYLPRRGHVPGAALVPFTRLFDEQERYLSRDQYLAELPEAVRTARELVAYCEVGVRAALFALLHEIHTGQVVPVCDGSIVEWAVSTDLPLETGLPG